MAGEWIKMRGNLWDDPRVAKLCDLTEQPEAPVIGGLYWLWAAADQHTVDGFMPGLTLRQIDRKTGVPGLAKALCEIGWLIEREDGCQIVKFEEHNGQSAKRRLTDAQRKANARSMSADDADNQRTDSGRDADEKRRDAELEKEKEKKEIHPPTPRKREGVHEFPPGFEAFWSAYPRKDGKKAAAKAFARTRPDEAMQARILAALERQKAWPQWAKDSGAFVPHAATWINGRRWEDEGTGDSDGGAAPPWAGAR